MVEFLSGIGPLGGKVAKFLSSVGLHRGKFPHRGKVGEFLSGKVAESLLSIELH